MLEHALSHPMGLVHLAVSLLTVSMGAAVLIARKATRRHRWLGRAYVAMMLAVNATALSIYELSGRFGPFHGMALFSLATVAAGYAPALRRRPGWRAPHAYFMTGSYIGLVAALVSETATRMDLLPFFAAVAVASLTVIGAGVWLMLRLMPRALSRS